MSIAVRHIGRMVVVAGKDSRVRPTAKVSIVLITENMTDVQIDYILHPRGNVWNFVVHGGEASSNLRYHLAPISTPFSLPAPGFFMDGALENCFERGGAGPPPNFSGQHRIQDTLGVSHGGLSGGCFRHSAPHRPF